MNKSNLTILHFIAIIVGVLLMGFGVWSFWVGAKNVLALPDMAGHELQYLVLFLFDILIFIVGAGTTSFSIYTIGTGHLASRIDDPSAQKRRFALLFLLVVVAIALLAIVVKILLFIRDLKTAF